jgi:hypothetical protein
MPQPFLGHLLQGVPLTKIALTPLEAASSPAVIHRTHRRAKRGLVTGGFQDAHAFRRSSPFPPTAMSFLSASPRRSHFPVALDFAWRSRRTGQLHLLRSFDPSVSPFAPIRANPDRRPLPSWRTVTFSFCPSGVSPPRPRRPATSSPSAAADRQLSWTFVPFSTCRIRRSLRCGGASRSPQRIRLQGFLPS